VGYQTSFPGGDTELVGNFEYRIPLFPHVALSIFGDAGATGAVRHDQLQLNSLDLSTLQNDFPGLNGSKVPRVAATLPFAAGTNFKPRTSAGLELVVQLPIVQAPFRIYWAYNFNRMSEVITAPQTQFPGTVSQADLTSTCIGTAAQCPWNIYKAQVGGLHDQPDIWNLQVVPQIKSIFTTPQKTNFFDPVRTFRFTVSRTF